MTLKSKTFLVSKGDTLEYVNQYLENEIGLNAYLIKDIQAVVLHENLVQLTILYNKYPTDILDSIAPREGAIFTSDISSSDFDIRFLFNYPIDYRSIQSGTFKIDGVGLDTTKIYLDPSSNNYYLKISASGSSFQTESFHSYQISSSLKRSDGSSFSYTPVGGYIFHSLSNAHIGDYFSDYEQRKRGKISIGVIRLSKGLSPQQGLIEYLSQRQISEDRLIAYNIVSSSVNTSDVFFIYLRKIEPQIVSGFPLNNSLLPNVSAPGKVTLVFNTKLDKAKLLSTPGLFTIESGYSTSTPVATNKINLLDDLKTVEIDVSTYFTSQKVYSIVARPGILGLDGLAKEKPEQWTIHISAYEPGAGGTGVGAPLDAQYLLYSADPDLDNAYVVTGDINTHLASTSNPHGTTAGQVGAPTIAQFSGHTGQSAIHFTQAEISIPSTQISNFTEAVQDVVGTFSAGGSGVQVTYSDVGNTLSFSLSGNLYTDILSHLSSTSNPHSTTAAQVGSPTIGEFTGHTGTTGIHFTQSQIDHSVLLNLTGDHHTGYVLANGNRIMNGELQSFVAATQPGSYIRKFESEQADFAVYVAAATDLFGHTSNTSNPHSTTAAQVGAPTLIQFTGHTGDTTIHFTQSQIAITASQVTNFGATVTGLVTGLITGGGGTGVSISDFSGHTGTTGIHFTQSQISIPSTQINNFTEATQDVVGTFLTGVTGIQVAYNDAGNTMTISMVPSFYTGVTGHTGSSINHVPPFTRAGFLGVLNGGSSVVPEPIYNDTIAVKPIELTDVFIKFDTVNDDLDSASIQDLMDFIASYFGLSP